MVATTIVSFPKVTIGAYDVVAYPASYGKKTQAYAMVYRTGTTKAVWETLSFTTAKQAIAAARKWIKEQ